MPLQQQLNDFNCSDALSRGHKPMSAKHPERLENTNTTWSLQRRSSPFVLTGTHRPVAVQVPSRRLFCTLELGLSGPQTRQNK